MVEFTKCDWRNSLIDNRLDRWSRGVSAFQCGTGNDDRWMHFALSPVAGYPYIVQAAGHVRHSIPYTTRVIPPRESACMPESSLGPPGATVPHFPPRLHPALACGAQETPETWFCPSVHRRGMIGRRGSSSQAVPRRAKTADLGRGHRPNKRSGLGPEKRNLPGWAGSADYAARRMTHACGRSDPGSSKSGCFSARTCGYDRRRRRSRLRPRAGPRG